MDNRSETLCSSWISVKAKSELQEYIKAILLAVILALAVRTCLLQSFRIPSSSMEDTLLVGDCLLVNKFVYGIRVPFTNLRFPMIQSPKQGDVIVFEYPKDRSKDYIKRVVGVPGDEILIKDKQVYVNGALYSNIHEVHKDPVTIPAISGKRDNFGPVRVPNNSYFVMGDNRDNSCDSRYWGFVGRSDLVGLAMIKWWSWDHDKWRVRWQRIGRSID